MRRPCYTLSSLVKFAFRSGELSLSMAELEQRLDEFRQENPQLIADALRQQPAAPLIESVLAAEESPIELGASQAIVQLKRANDPLADAIVRILEQKRRPLTAEQIGRQLWKRRLIRQMKQPLPLRSEIRLVQVEGDARWFLRSWYICNDEVYRFLRADGVKGGYLQDVNRKMERDWQMPREQYLFLPELDSRFKVWEDRFLIQDEEPDVIETVEVKDEKETDKGETTMMENQQVNQQVGQKPVLPTVIQQIEEAVQLLKVRNEVMQGEVLAAFTSNNMEQIERLMEEKQANEAALHELNTFLQQREVETA